MERSVLRLWRKGRKVMVERKMQPKSFLFAVKCINYTNNEKCVWEIADKE